MKRFSILSLILILGFSVLAIADENPLPPDYYFHQSLVIEKIAGGSIPSPVQALLPVSGWDYHDGYLKAESTTDVYPYEIGTTAYAALIDSTVTEIYSESYEGHFGNDSTPIHTGGVRSGSFYRVTMFAVGGTTPPCRARSTATLKLDFFDPLANLEF